MSYHYGMTIREGREAAHMTQAQLAEMWPQAGDGTGVSANYVSAVERGLKHIADIQTLRRLCDILSIPYWKVGLGEYDPFNEQATSSQKKNGLFLLNLDSMETVIEQTWRCKLVEPLPVIQNYVNFLSKQCSIIKDHYPHSYVTNKRFLRVYAQVERLQAIIYTDKSQFKNAQAKNYAMLNAAKELDEAAPLALAYARVGLGLIRDDKVKDSIDALETARDYTFHTSKNLAALVNAFLARAYATNGDVTRFERTINTAINLSAAMGDRDMDTTDNVFYSKSGIIEEKSNGYILLKQAGNALSVLPYLEDQVKRENNHYLHTWMPLEWAQVHLLSGEVEASLQQLRAYLQSCSPYQSPWMLSLVSNHLREIIHQGYGDVQAVKNFQEEITQTFQEAR
jgi:transcriptional regulator with XRE-family HTH domain